MIYLYLLFSDNFPEKAETTQKNAFASYQAL